MSADQIEAMPGFGSQVQTACGDATLLNPDTPQTVYRYRRVYFCQQACREDFERDPLSSCLSWQLPEDQAG